MPYLLRAIFLSIQTQKINYLAYLYAFIEKGNFFLKTTQQVSFISEMIYESFYGFEVLSNFLIIMGKVAPTPVGRSC